ncbi:MAG: ABC transporter permease [Polyangiaceae bacterium]|nr:ABC transporter permease [Polyangiaceae bacterium]MCB9607915.1 ABC transporter permease [Polyangiaceae bacterium]
MSAQTGEVAEPAPPPTSTRFERAKHQARRVRYEPNPVWMREMRQAARLSRTPLILASLTAVIALLICSIGGVASVSTEPAKVGSVLFHTYFSLAFAVVTWVGPAVAASTIASERSGRTWHALLLTGLGAETITRGKFLAALSYISMYVVMLAPVGVLPFLFGGVTATEVLAAFALLFWIAVLSVAFGLSLSSRFNSSAAAILVTLIISFPLSILAYVFGGPVLSNGVHDLWPGVPDGPPVWLPTAYVRADFGFAYVAFLILIPIALVALPAWFLYESTVANMAGPSEDRSSGLRRWFLVAGPGAAVASWVAVFAVDKNDQGPAALVCVGLQLIFYFLVAMVFAGEPLGPSRRVRVHWERQGVSKLKRYLGPGIMQASSLLMTFGVGSMVLTCLAGLLGEMLWSTSRFDEKVTSLFVFTGYAVCFFVFTVGFISWMRSRSTGSANPRVLTLVAVLVAMVGPWIVMAIGGALSDPDSALILAAPSPTYAFVMIEQIFRSGSDLESYLAAGIACSAGWAVLGLALFTAAGIRTKKAIREHDEAQARLEAVLEEEDRALAAAEAEPQGAEPPEPAPESDFSPGPMSQPPPASTGPSTQRLPETDAADPQGPVDDEPRGT